MEKLTFTAGEFSQAVGDLIIAYLKPLEKRIALLERRQDVQERAQGELDGEFDSLMIDLRTREVIE